VFNFNFDIKLSTRPLKALGSVELWKKAESALADAITATGKPWKINPGDGAFYGPKIDIRIQDALQRWHQCGTIQLDFQLPLRFNLMYRTEQITSKSDNIHSNKEIDVSSENVVNTEKKEENHSLEEPLKPGYERPVMIHRAILGSIERMLAVLLEHTSGKLPFWLSPRQALICPINSKINNYAQQVCDILRKNGMFFFLVLIFTYLRLLGFEVEVEETNATINKKIRQAQLERWCFVLVVGAQEEEKQTVMLRDCSNPKSQKELNIEEVLNLFKVYNVPGYKASM
jgi:threonyl-tRNA synthetase